MIGAIGSKELADVIMFEASFDAEKERILTLREFERRNSVRFARNDVLLRKPVSQYIGPALDVLTFKIILRAQFGVNPRAEQSKLIHLQRSGTTVSVVIGNWVQGVFRWRINNLGLPAEIIDNNGVIISSTLSISLEEYV